MRNTTINDDFLRRAEMAKRDGVLPKHAVVAVPRSVEKESRDKERDRDSYRDKDRDRDRDRDRRRGDRDYRDRDRKRDRSRSRTPPPKNYVPPAINPHLNLRKNVEKPKGQADLKIASFPHGAWNVNNGKSTVKLKTIKPIIQT